MQVITKGALLDGLRQRQRSLASQSPSPALSTAQQRLSSDLVQLTEVPGADTTEMDQFLEQEAKNQRWRQRAYLGAAATSVALGMVAPFLKGPFWLPTVGVVAAIPLGVKGLKANAELGRVQEQQAALKRWARPNEGQAPTGGAGTEFVPVGQQPKVSELRDVLRATRGGLEQLNDGPMLGFAKARVERDTRAVAELEEQPLNQLQNNLKQQNRELTNSIQLRAKVALGLGVASLAGFTVTGLFCPPLLPLCGLGLIGSMGLLLSNQPAERERSENHQVLNVVNRWEPVVKVHQRVEQSGSQVEKLAGGTELEGLTVEEDGLQIGDVFLPFS